MHVNHDISLGTRTAVVNTETFTFIYSGLDFQTASGSSTLEGPLSLSLDVTNNLFYPLYIGIQLTTLNGVINIGDRTHIAFVNKGEHKVISAASVPQLARIRGTITSITILVYSFGTQPLQTNTLSVALRIGAPVEIAAPQEIIGRDRQAFIPGLYRGESAYNVSIAAGAVRTTVVFLGGVVDPFRFRVKTVSISIPPTPSYAGDLIVYVNVLTVSNINYDIAVLRSERDRDSTFLLQSEFELTEGYDLRVQATNNNTTLAKLCNAVIGYEMIY